MNDYCSWELGFKRYEHLKVMDDRTTHGRELKSLDDMNNLGLWLTWTSLGHEIRALVLG